MSEITERLRNRIHDSHMDAERLMDDAADHIEAQEARIDELEKALGDIKDIIQRRHDSGEMVDGGDLRYWIDLVNFALSKPQTQ